jgi:hypothetical protein
VAIVGAGGRRTTSPSNAEPARDEQAGDQPLSPRGRLDRAAAVRESCPVGGTLEIGDLLLRDEVMEVSRHQILEVLDGEAERGRRGGRRGAALLDTRRCDGDYAAGWMFWLIRNTLPGS